MDVRMYEYDRQTNIQGRDILSAEPRKGDRSPDRGAQSATKKHGPHSGLASQDRQQELTKSPRATTKIIISAGCSPHSPFREIRLILRTHKSCGCVVLPSILPSSPQPPNLPSRRAGCNERLLPLSSAHLRTASVHNHGGFRISK